MIDSILTVNKLGYVKEIGSIIYFASETNPSCFWLKNDTEKQKIVAALLAGVDTELPLYGGTLKMEMLPPGSVIFKWTSPHGQEIATFGEIELMQFLAVEHVSTLVRSRKS